MEVLQEEHVEGVSMKTLRGVSLVFPSTAVKIYPDDLHEGHHFLYLQV